MTERIVVIGADAAGMSAASQAKRIAGDAVEIVAFERGAYSSYSACGIPYWIAGDVDGPERLVARSPDAHRRNGIDLRMRTEVEKIDLAAGRVLAHDRAAGRSFREGFDSLVIATGAVPVRPPLPGVDAAGVFGVQVLGHENIWAGGDCVEVLNLVSGQYQHVALGTHANKQGRVIGHNLAGSYATFPGVVGTAVSKVCHLEIARTGLRERDATRAGFGYVTVTVRSSTKAGYFPGTQRMNVKMTAERCTGRLLGVQIVGQEGSAKRIDTAATALRPRRAAREPPRPGRRS